MFRKLAEAFQDSNNSGSSAGNHADYITNQNVYFQAVPNIIPSATSGLKGFGKAVQSVEPQINTYQPTFNKYPDAVFMPDSKPGLEKIAKQCASSSLDELIAIKNPNAAIGCGWLYTPPAKNSPYPTLSKGFIGNTDGPLDTFSPPDHKKWFFDLQLAKKQILLDKCKALKGCTDIDSDVFKGSCGYCTDTNQGVPIDNVGKPLYGGDPIGTCSPESIVTTGSGCPPPPEAGSGPQPIVDRTCQPTNGRLSASCLYDRVISAGCSDNGSLAIALSAPASPSDYIANIRNGDAVKIYNRVANPPLKLDVFTQGATTVDMVLKEARQLAGNAKTSPNTALGYAARDLCLQSGAIKNYDFCSDLPDSTQSPFDITCLQQLFRKLGGQPTGKAYPSTGSTMATYNSMGTLGAIKQYWNEMIQRMKSTEYEVQRDAMIQFLGIQPENVIKRAPYSQGVEIFWFSQVQGVPNRVNGFLRRTIRNDFLQFGGAVSPNVGSVPAFTNIIQLTDVRAPADFSTKFSVTIDDGFFITANQPVNSDAIILNDRFVDKPNMFANIGLQGPTTYTSKNCFNFKGGLPNITKMFYEDAGGGGQQFTLNLQACSGTTTFTPPYYSLTCEKRAPFLNFEVNANNGSFEETRNPGMFSQFIGISNVEYHMRTEERNSVPGNKSFMRINNGNSIINLMNIAYQSWGTVTFAFRLHTMPVKDAIFSFWVFNKFCSFYLQPVNGSTAQMRINTNMTTNNTVYDGATNFNLNVGSWYFMEVAQTGQGFDVYCDSIDNIVKNGNYTTQYTKITNSGPITTNINNGLYVAGQYSCNIVIGGKASGFNMSNSSFLFDVAWVHYYDYYISAAEVVKDAKSAWIFTNFPDSSGNYKTLG